MSRPPVLEIRMAVDANRQVQFSGILVTVRVADALQVRSFP